MIEKIKKAKAKVAVATMGAAGALAALPAVAFAEDSGGSSTVASQMGTLATSVQSDAMATITAVLPAIIGVVGVGVVVGIGIKWIGKMRKG